MADKKLMKTKVPPYYKYTECRVEGHHWTSLPDYPKRSDAGGIIYRSKCPGCSSERVRYFNHRGIRVPERCYTIYPVDYQIKGGLPRPHFIVQMALDAGIED